MAGCPLLHVQNHMVLSQRVCVVTQLVAQFLVWLLAKLGSPEDPRQGSTPVLQGGMWWWRVGSRVSPSPTPIPALLLPTTHLTLLSPWSFCLRPLGIAQYRPQEDAGGIEHDRACQRIHTVESSSHEHSAYRWLLGCPEPKPEALAKDRDHRGTAACAVERPGVGFSR